MSRELFSSLIEQFSEREPFRTYTIELKDGTRIEIDTRRGSLAFRDDHAMAIVSKLDFRPFRIPDVAYIFDASSENAS